VYVASETFSRVGRSNALVAEHVEGYAELGQRLHLSNVFQTPKHQRSHLSAAHLYVPARIVRLRHEDNQPAGFGVTVVRVEDLRIQSDVYQHLFDFERDVHGVPGEMDICPALVLEEMFGAVIEPASVESLKAAVEGMHGGTARFKQAVPVRETFGGAAVWEGVVHVFELQDNPTATRAYAWSSPIEGSDRRRFFAVLHIPPITSPVEAVRAAIVAEHRHG
jgi:hypothetical protein